ILNVYAPSVVGVPEMTPFVSVRPGGSAPPATAHVSGPGAAPVGGFRLVTSWASRVVEYGSPTLATCGIAFVTIRSPGSMVIVKSRCAHVPLVLHQNGFATPGQHGLVFGSGLSDSSAQKTQVPACVGVPVIGPFDASDSPGGSVPDSNTYEYGGPFPVSGAIGFRMWLYELPTVPVGGRHGFVLSQLSSLNASAAAVATKTH